MYFVLLYSWFRWRWFFYGTYFRKNTVNNYTDIQCKVREATCNEPWGPATTVMTEIADATYSVWVIYLCFQTVLHIYLNIIKMVKLKNCVFSFSSIIEYGLVHTRRRDFNFIDFAFVVYHHCLFSFYPSELSLLKLWPFYGRD